jgi:hypothetical protein
MFGQFLPECGAVGAPPLAPPAGAVVVAPEEPVEPVEPVVAALAIAAPPPASAPVAANTANAAFMDLIVSSFEWLMGPLNAQRLAKP